MKGILIDPDARTVTAVDYEDSHRGITRALECDNIEHVHISGSIFKRGWHGCYVNGEELTEGVDNPRHFFQLHTEHGLTNPMAGRGLVVGGDGDKGMDAIMTAEQVKAITKFTTRAFRGFRSRTDVPGYDLVIEMDAPLIDGENED